jgi:hypothetical protein
MQLASYAANIDSNQTFERMGRAIQEFNSADFVSELYRYREGAGAYSRGEGGYMMRVNVGLSGLLDNWNLRSLGHRDFERAIATTRQFRMKEAAALVQLSICRGALARLPKAPAVTK